MPGLMTVTTSANIEGDFALTQEDLSDIVVIEHEQLPSLTLNPVLNIATPYGKLKISIRQVVEFSPSLTWTKTCLEDGES